MQLTFARMNALPAFPLICLLAAVHAVTVIAIATAQGNAAVATTKINCNILLEC